VPVEKTFQTRRWVSHQQIAAAPDFICDFLGHITRPAIRSIETNDPHRIVVLAVEKVGNYGFEVCCLDIVKWTRFLGPWAKLEIGRSV
jgi:hypothetical protein